MLQSLRDGLGRHKWLAWLALLPIGLIFAFWGGSNSLDHSGGVRQEAAEVDGEKIPATEATRAWSQAQARWAQQTGDEMPAEQRKRTQDQILDQLVRDRLLDARFAEQNYRVGEGRVLAEIEKIPAFRGADGKYDPAMARQVLQSNSITETELLKELRQQILLTQLQQGIAQSYFLMPAEKNRLFNLENEEREVEYAKFDAAQFAGGAPVDDAAIKAYYDKNGDRFMTIESVSLEYAELRVEQLASQVQPNEADLRKMYDDNRANYVLEERRRARYIVIPVTGTDDAGARKQAESVLAEARAGKDFGELARKYSKDVTASQGGEIGFFQHKDIPGPIGDALFSMKVNDIAGPIKSDAGYHIIQLEEIQSGEVKPFESVRAELDSQYRQETAANTFGERQEQISSLLEKGEKDLDKFVHDLGMTHGSIAQFLRGGGAEPLGSGAELQRVVFDDATLNQGKIGGPVALGEDRLVLVKVTAHHKPEVKPLAQVRDEIIGLLQHERGVTAAKSAAEDVLKKVESGEKLATLAPAAKATVEAPRFVGRGDPSIPAALRSAVFEAPRPEGKPVAKLATLDDGSTAVFVLTRTRTADTSVNPQLVQQQGMALQQRAAVGDVAAYLSDVKAKAKIVKYPEVFE